MTAELTALAKRIRQHVLEMTYRAQVSHVGSCLSVADILAVLYGEILNASPEAPEKPDRDRLIMSKGHAAAALYAVLAERGFIPIDQLQDYCHDGSELMGHVSHYVSGVELSTGSLGHGLPVGAGIALAASRMKKPYRAFVVLSDGELDEGSNWEAALFAGHHRLENLIAIVDYNKIQSFGRVEEVLALEPLADKWRAFGWSVQETDGHDIPALGAALTTPQLSPNQPNVLIAHTVKGKGVPFMEDQLVWHYKPPNEEQFHRALAALEVLS